MRKSYLAVLAFAALFAIALSELALALDPWNNRNDVSAPAQAVLAVVAFGTGWVVSDGLRRLRSRGGRSQCDG